MQIRFRNPLYALLLLLCLIGSPVRAQEFYEVDWTLLKVDSLLPNVLHTLPLPDDADGNECRVRLLYPEYEPLPAADVERVQKMAVSLPSTPHIECVTAVTLKQPNLQVSVCPIVLQDGSYRRLLSYKLEIDVDEKNKITKRQTRLSSSVDTKERYTTESLLAKGKWVKIKVPSTGVYKITRKELSAMGFTRPEKVRMYGQGGYQLSESQIHLCVDDLKEVPLYRGQDYLLFHAKGVVKWNRQSNGRFVHTNNTYSTHGYYFLTEDNSEESPTEFPVSPSAGGGEEVTTYPDYVLYEKDLLSWFERGRLFLDDEPFTSGTTRKYSFDIPGMVDTEAYIKVSFASDATIQHSLSVLADGIRIGSVNIPSAGGYTHFQVGTNDALIIKENLSEKPIISLSYTGQSTGYLDYITMNFTRSLALRGAYTYFRATKAGKQTFCIAGADAQSIVWKISDRGTEGDVIAKMEGSYSDGCYRFSDEAKLTDEYVVLNPTSSGFPSVNVVGKVENQNLHGLGKTDMLIIVPTSAKWLSQAERLAELHRTYDSMRVEVVRADRIYNEFSSGTPDATAIRRFLKMLYDRAETPDDMPKHLLLFADCTADNRMLTTAWKRYSPDDFLLSYQSELSSSEVDSYILEEYFAFLDDDEGGSWHSQKSDVAVGRLPVRNLEQARIIVDKIEQYLLDDNAGTWKTRYCMMADEDPKTAIYNDHMEDAERVISTVTGVNPNFFVEKLYWDVFPRVSSSTGVRYPVITERIKELAAEGVLMFNYFGHGRADALSHELVWTISDMGTLTTTRPTLWVTAGCDISPIDLPGDNMGEVGLFNEKGGAVAFLGTTRATFGSLSMPLDVAFSKYLFKGETMGEALRLAKNETGYSGNINNHHFVLLGDPALKLPLPDEYRVMVTTINGKPITTAENNLFKAGSQVTLGGCIVDDGGNVVKDFNGTITPVVYDSRELVTCLGHDLNEEDTKFQYWDYSKKLFSGVDSIQSGSFEFTFPVPLDISYSQDNGAVFFFARSEDKREAHGKYENFVLAGTADELKNDSVGPRMEVFLNSSDFVTGDRTNETPLLVVNLYDEDGINATGNGIGHDLMVIIDNNPLHTYILNNYYVAEAGDYTHGTVTYSLPQLSEGKHTLMVRAWDVLNNSSTTYLEFEVVKGLRPTISDAWCTASPARKMTTFVVRHNRPMSAVNIAIEVFDFAGQLVWKYEVDDVPEGNELRVPWNLTTTSGQPLNSGIYLYRVSFTSSEGKSTSKVRKLGVIRQ